MASRCLLLAYSAAPLCLAAVAACVGGDPASPSVEEWTTFASGAGVGVRDAGADAPTDVTSDILESASCETVSCPQDWPDACPSPAPSYMTYVRNIIVAGCSPCHFPNGVDDARRDYSTFQRVQHSSSEMWNSVATCHMPPCDAGALARADRQALLAWLLPCGAPNN